MSVSKDPILQVKSHVFYGRKYNFFYGDIRKKLTKGEIKIICNKFGLRGEDTLLGATDDNRSKKKMIIVSDSIEQTSPKDLLRVLIDEAMHALDSTIDNDVVAEKATDLSNFLWRCGYRRIKPEDSVDSTHTSEEV